MEQATQKQIDLLENLGVEREAAESLSFEDARDEIEWRLKTPSDAQIKFLRDMGFTDPEALTRHEAQKKISQFASKATSKQVAYARSLGASQDQISASDTKERMNLLIRRLRARTLRAR